MYKKILFACDLSENHFDLCKRVVKFAHSMNANLQLLHVIEIPTSLQWAQSLGFAELATPNKEGATAVLNSLGDTFKLPLSHLHVEIGSTYAHILETAERLHCDLIILGHASDNLSNILGTTAHSVLHHALCDVLTMR